MMTDAQTQSQTQSQNSFKFLQYQANKLLNLNRNPYLAVLLAVSCLAYLVSPYVPPLHTFAWLLLVLLCQQARRLYIAHLLRQSSAPEPQPAMHALVGFSFLNGCAVGLSAPLFFTGSPDFVRAGITVVLVGLVSGSSAAAAASLPIFIAYILPALLPLAYCWAIVGGETILISGLVLLLMGVLLGFARETQHMLKESFDIRFEREQLLQELKSTHAEVLEAKENAEQAGQAKARVLAAASHDLRQPLHALSLYSAVLASTPNQQTLASVAQNIDASVRALSALLNALLDLSRLDAGVFPVKLSHFDVQDVLNQVCKDFASLAKEKGLTLQQQTVTAVVHSDPIVFERIARNLIDNAIKYTNQGSVTVCANVIGDTIEIAVHDTGRGIPLSEQKRIFEEFYQLHNPGRDREQGLGLGLSIVQRLAGLVGSTIQLRSTEAYGSIFSWQLPRAADAMTTPTLATMDASTLAASATVPDIHTGAHVLIIDDEVAVRHSMGLLLERWGLHAHAAADVAEAQSIMENAHQAIALIIADLRLKDGADGLQVALSLRRRWGPIPVLLASGETDPAKLKHIASSGFMLLHKPISPEIFLATVVDLLAGQAATA